MAPTSPARAGLWPWGWLHWGPLTVPAERQAKTSPSSLCLWSVRPLISAICLSILPF